MLTVILLLPPLPVRAGQRLADIKAQIKAGHYQKALQLLDKGLATDKTNPHYLFYRARALAASGQTVLAKQAYEKLIKLKPDLPEAYNNLAVIYMQAGETEQARALLNKAMATHPTYATVYKNIIRVNTSKAQDAYAKALQMPDTRPATNLQVAEQLSLAEKPVPSVRPAPIVETAAKSAQEPALVYKARQEQVDKKGSVAAQAVPDTAEIRAVKAMLVAWAQAWSGKQVDQYLQYYTAEYAPVGMSHRFWAAQRRQRIKRPQWIRVELENFKLKAIDGQHMVVRLEQKYRADNYSDVTRKEFVVQKVAGQWRISEERGLGYIVR